MSQKTKGRSTKLKTIHEKKAWVLPKGNGKKRESNHSLKPSIAELALAVDQQQLSNSRRIAEFSSAKLARSIAKFTEESKMNQQHRQKWIKSQIDFWPPIS
jgi:hypothetical protein